MAASFGAATVLNKRKKRKNSTWVKQYIRERESLGAYNALLSELATDEVTRCVTQYLRMDIATFEELFLQVEKQITRRATKAYHNCCTLEFAEILCFCVCVRP